jgi:hypothetical protein
MICLAAVTSGCYKFEHKSSNSPITPSPSPQPSSLAGTWTSAGAVGVPDTNSCTNFQWVVTNVSGPTVSGNFSATCAGGFQASGTGAGTVNGQSLTWNASGNASQSGVTCPFSLSGTAVPQSSNTQIRIEYAGSVCATPVNGTQILQRN